MERKLHIGGLTAVQGWEVLNAVPGPVVDHVCNAAKLDIFSDQTFSAIYASHVVEHFDYKDALLAVLKEWHRVLRPGGILYVSVPDLDTLARLFIDRERLSIQDRFHVMKMIFGAHIDQYDYHLVGLNTEILAGWLIAAGFSDVQKVDAFGLFDDTSSMVFHGVPISLNLTCRRPALPGKLRRLASRIIPGLE